MASTVLVKDVLWSVSVLLQDTVPQFQRHVEVELVDWLNDAQMALTKFLPPACSRVGAMKLKPGTRQSIETILAADFKPAEGGTLSANLNGTQLLDLVRNMGADGLTPGRVIRRTERKILDSQSPTWHTVTGSAVSSFMYDPETPRYFLVTPAVPSGGSDVWAEISLTAQPRRIPAGGAPGAEKYVTGGTGATEVISVNDEHRDDLINYVVARANMKPTEWTDANKAQAFAGMFLNSLNAKVAALTGNSPNLKALPFAPEPLGRAAA